MSSKVNKLTSDLNMEKVSCKEWSQALSRFGTYEETGLDVPGMVGEAEWEADGY